MTEPRYRRRAGARWTPIEKMRMAVSVWGDGLSIAEAAQIHGLAGRTGRSARNVIAELRRTRVPQLAKQLRAADPDGRVDALAARLVELLARGEVGAPPKITASYAKQMEVQTEGVLQALAQKWGTCPDAIRTRLGWRDEIHEGAEQRADAAVGRLLALISLSNGLAAGTMPGPPEYHDPHAHEKFKSLYPGSTNLADLLDTPKEIFE